MELLNADDLDIMISPENQDILDDLFDRKEKEVKTLCDELQRVAKEQAESEGSDAAGDSSQEGKTLKGSPIVVRHM